jgi:hypothetical protein
MSITLLFFPFFPNFILLYHVTNNIYKMGDISNKNKLERIIQMMQTIQNEVPTILSSTDDPKTDENDTKSKLLNGMELLLAIFVNLVLCIMPILCLWLVRLKGPSLNPTNRFSISYTPPFSTLDFTAFTKPFLTVAWILSFCKNHKTYV